MLNDVRTLAKEHCIEEYLYYGDSLTKVYQIIGDARTTKFLSNICDDDLQQYEIWERLISFLDEEKRVYQQKILIQEHASPKQSIDRNQNHHQPNNR